MKFHSSDVSKVLLMTPALSLAFSFSNIRTNTGILMTSRSMSWYDLEDNSSNNSSKIEHEGEEEELDIFTIEVSRN